MGLQEYVYPATAAAPIVPDGVVQVKFWVDPAFAVGTDELTFTVTVDVAVQPLLPVTVTV